MAEKPVLNIGHIKITDHLTLGVTKHKVESGEENFEHFTLKTDCKIGWNEIDAGICNGSLDGAFILAPMAINLYGSGEKIKLLLFGHKNGSILVANKTAKVTALGDFKGKTIIIPYQLSIHHMLLHEMLKKENLTAGAGKDVQLEVFAPVQIPEAIEFDEEGEIGGFIVAEPFGSQTITAGTGNEFKLSKELWPNHPCCVFIMRQEVIDKYPEAVQELVTSLVESGKFIENEPAKAAEIGAEFLSQKKDVIERVLTEPADRIKTNEMKPVCDDLCRIQDYMSDEMSILKNKIEMNDLVDLSFAEKAQAV